MTSSRHFLFLLVGLAVGCDSGDPADAGLDAGGRDASVSDAGTPSDAGPTLDDAGASDAGLDGGMSMDAGESDAGALDAGTDAGRVDAGAPDSGGPVTFDVRIRADGFCDMLSFDPPSIAVPRGSEFTVNWINATGCTDIDIDMGGTVPIVIGLPAGGSYHDTVRSWCGTYTGTYTFRAYYAPSYTFTMLADCDA